MGETINTRDKEKSPLRKLVDKELHCLHDELLPPKDYTPYLNTGITLERIKRRTNLPPLLQNVEERKEGFSGAIQTFLHRKFSTDTGGAFPEDHDRTGLIEIPSKNPKTAKQFAIRLDAKGITLGVRNRGEDNGEYRMMLGGFVQYTEDVDNDIYKNLNKNGFTLVSKVSESNHDARMKNLHCGVDISGKFYIGTGATIIKQMNAFYNTNKITQANALIKTVQLIDTSPVIEIVADGQHYIKAIESSTTKNTTTESTGYRLNISPGGTGKILVTKSDLSCPVIIYGTKGFVLQGLQKYIEDNGPCKLFFMDNGNYSTLPSATGKEGSKLIDNRNTGGGNLLTVW